MLSSQHFVKPKLILDPNTNKLSVAPRQKLQRGMLVKVSYNRWSRKHNSIVNLGAKGSYVGRLMEIGTSDTVKWAKVKVLDGGYSAAVMEDLCFPIKTVEMAYPSSDHAELFPFIPCYGEVFFTKVRDLMKRHVKSRLVEKAAQWFSAANPNYNEGSIRNQMISNLCRYDYWANAVKETKKFNSPTQYLRSATAKMRNAIRTPNDAGKLFSKTLGKLRKYKAQVSDSESTANINRTLHTLRKQIAMCAVSTSQGYGSTTNAQKLNFIFDAEVKRLFGFTSLAGCGHWTSNEPHTVQRSAYIGAQPATVCDACINATMSNGSNRYRTYEGHTYDMDMVAFYMWDDGIERPQAPPPVINGYHSSRYYHTSPLPNPDGTKASQLPYLGVELEFVGSGNAKRTHEQCARAMHQAVAGVFPWVSNNKPYMLFERDGSVDFEMVTGYGPISTHREAMIAMFSGNPYKRDLRSHDGGRCGIHVHLDKPKTLLHAAKLVKFWNDAGNRPLVECVARRYNAGNSYAQAQPSKGDFKRVVKDAYGAPRGNSHRGNITSRAQITKGAMVRLNTAAGAPDRGTRYALCNFMNDKTVELRGFRGTLRVKTIIACLEFGLMSWYFSRDTEPHLLTSQQFIDYINQPRWRHETRFLREYLAAKSWPGVWMPRPNLTSPLATTDTSSEVLEGIDESNNPF